LRDVPSDFPILGKPGTEFESAVVSSKHKKTQEKTNINLPQREILESNKKL